MRDVLLFSGGLDSLIAYFYLDKPLCLFVNMKQKYAEVEIKRVKRLKEEIGFDLVIDNMSFDFSSVEQEDLTIPNRNAYLAMLASNYGDNIWMAAVNGDYNHDKTPFVFNEMSKFISVLKQRSVKVDSPFWSMTKTDMIKWYVDQGLNKDWLKLSYSCFTGNDIHCGRCTSCFRRWIGMYNNNINEDYMENPLDWEVIPQYIKRMIYKEKDTDTQERREEFLQAMFKAGIYVPQTTFEWVEQLRKRYKKL